MKWVTWSRSPCLNIHGIDTSIIILISTYLPLYLPRWTWKTLKNFKSIHQFLNSKLDLTHKFKPKITGSKGGEWIHIRWKWRNTYNPSRCLSSPLLRFTPLPYVTLIPQSIRSRKSTSSLKFLQYDFLPLRVL